MYSNPLSLEPQEFGAQGPIAEADFKEAMEKRSVPVYYVPIMLLGGDRAGKTSLKKFRRAITFDPDEESTVHYAVISKKGNAKQRTQSKQGLNIYSY